MTHSLVSESVLQESCDSYHIGVLSQPYPILCTALYVNIDIRFPATSYKEILLLAQRDPWVGFGTGWGGAH